jgi:hypothetical protein
MVDFPRPPLVLRHWSKAQLQNQPLGYSYVNIPIATSLPVDSTNLPSNTTSWFNPWGRLPLNVGFVKEPQPAAAAVEAMPPGQQSMVLPPRAPPHCVTLLTHTDSFKLPLQQVLPTGKLEQTLPPISQRRNLPDWQDYILPWAQAPPQANYDWPNPRGRRPLVLDWTLAGNAISPIAQAEKPFAQTEWPVPKAPARLIALGHGDSFKLPLQQVLPPHQTEWPVPRGPRPLVRDWTDSFKLPLQEVLPPHQTNWPNPRAVLRPVEFGTWIQSPRPAANELPCTFEWFNPWGPRRFPQDWIAATPNALTAAPTAPPIAQRDWPNPRGRQQPVRDWTDSFKLPIQQVLPPRQTDWLNPRGPQRLVDLSWAQSPRPPVADTTNLPSTAVAWFNPWGRQPPNVGSVQSSGQWLLSPVATEAIIRQADWPVPKGPRQPVRDWTDSFKLPLQEVLPPRQTDWPNPRAALQSVGFGAWTQSPRPPEPDLTNLPCTAVAWFNPWGRRRSVDLLTWTSPVTRAEVTVYVSRPPTFFRTWAPRRLVDLTWTQSPRPPAPTLPIRQADWPNPHGSRRNPQDWSDSFKLPLQQVLPPHQTDWPNPRASRRNPQDWIQATPYTLTVAPASPPIRQTDWPNPRGPKPLVEFGVWIQSPRPPVPDTLAFTSWFNPWGPRRRIQDWIQPTNLALTSASAPTLPARQTDWSNPRGPRRNPQDWSGSSKLPLQQVLPPRQMDWPVPKGPRPVVWDWSDSFKLPLQQVLPPRQTDWPVPRAPRRNPQDWQSYTLPISQVPLRQLDWPNPTLRKPPVVVSWAQSPSIAVTFVQSPFNQTDWPLPPRVKLGVLQTWSDSFKLPLQQTLPPRQLDWPNPRGRVSYDLRGYAVRNIPVASVPPKPYNQYDWPNPRGPRQPVITARDFVVGIIPPIPPVYDVANTLKNEIRRLRYLENKTGRIRFLKNEIRR